MEVNPVDVRDVLVLGAFALTFVGLLALVGNVTLIDIRRELRRTRRDLRTTTHAVRAAADEAHQRARTVRLGRGDRAHRHPTPGALDGSTHSTSKEEPQ